MRNFSAALSRIFEKPWYPLALSAYPAIALLAANAGQVGVAAVVRPLLISIAFGAILYFLLWLVFRKAHKAAFLAALWLALFFSYGHIYIAIDDAYPDSGYTRWLAIAAILLFLFSIVWVTRPKLSFASAAAPLNTIALALVIIAAVNTTVWGGPHGVHALGLSNAPIEKDLTAPANPPDVYFFLLDSYGRADLLESAYGFDNSPFLNALQQRGFYVAQCSQSNYVRTELSLGSSLNMQYLPALSDAFGPDSQRRGLLWDALKHSAVRWNFESLGYEMVTYDTGFAWLNVDDAEHFMKPPAISSGMTDFESLFLRTTAARYAQDLGWVDPDYLLGVGFRDRFKNVFNTIGDVPHNPAPTFTYAHLISPHPPFVFDPNGNPTYPPDFWNEQRAYPADLYQKGYVNQLPFLNKNMLQAIDTILSESKTPPIIIIQGDHGPWLQPTDKRFWNLTAIYFPDHAGVLYPTISPVNIFRLVFNTYFGGKYLLLSDDSYFSPVPRLFDFSAVPHPCDFPNN